jgi:hypothetical protein
MVTLWLQSASPLPPFLSRLLRSHQKAKGFLVNSAFSCLAAIVALPYPYWPVVDQTTNSFRNSYIVISVLLLYNSNQRENKDMGRIWLRRAEMIGALSEIVGYKSGLALTKAEILKYLPEYESTLTGRDNAIITLRAEEYQEMTSTLLYSLGCLAFPPIVFPGVKCSINIRMIRTSMNSIAVS